MRKQILPFFLFLVFAYAHPLAADVTIHDDAGLMVFANQSATEDFANQVINLTADIDLAGQAWTPIGSAALPFKGHFKGNGHTIKGLHTFNATDGIGLFGHVAQEAVIEQVGISGGTLVAKGGQRRRIGALAGVCDGTIRECWSMATIAAAGNVCGGLVGELQAHGQLTDCYHAGLILNGADTVADIVGLNNGGVLTRVYNTGYAKNGRAIVHTDHNGVYTDCYYDRKLYYPEAAPVVPGITPLDETALLFNLFAGNATWSHAADRYPILGAFGAGNDAALLSAAPMFIDTEQTDPVNHANDLTEDFTVSPLATWACQNIDDERWIDITGTQIYVVRPCAETDVLVNATRNGFTRVVYMRPRRWNDFLPGKVYSNYKEFCYTEEAIVSDHLMADNAKFGWETERYYYLVERSIINAAGDTVPVDTLYNGELTPDVEYTTWTGNAKIPTTQAGLFVLRRYAHDSHCVLDWVRSPGQLVYRVFGEFNPGEIEDKTDTVYLPTTISIASIQPATGGGGPITYLWYTNGAYLTGTNSEALTDFAGITTAGDYTFTRTAMDSAQCAEGNKTATGKYKVLVLDPFDPGTVNAETDLHFCTPEEANAHVITATEATGGLKPYHYQWYRREGTLEYTISGATSRNLNLSGISFEAGKDYVFVRKATDDTHKLPLALSQSQQKIHIMATLDPGSIEDGTRDNYCAPYDADPLATVTVTIDGSTATGESGLEYSWKRTVNGVEEIISDKEDLDVTYLLSELLGKTVSYSREVRNHPDCPWEGSTGKVTQYYGQETRATVNKTICKEKLPYTMKWIDGSEHTFTADGESWEVSDTRGECKADTVFTIHTVEMPVFSIQDTAHLCQETGIIAVNFQQTAGLSDVFRIHFSPYLAGLIGRSDTTGTITVNGTIILRDLPSIGEGESYLDVQIGYSGETAESEEVCYSDAHRMYLDISLGGYIHTKYDRVLFVDNNPDSNRVDGMTEKLKFVAYQWYKNGIALEGETNQYYHEGGKKLEGVFFAMLTDTQGRHYRSCDVEIKADGAAAPQASHVYPVPVAAGEAITVEAVGSAQLLSFSGERVSPTVRVEGKATLTAPYMTGLYYVQVVTEEGVMEMHKIIVK